MRPFWALIRKHLHDTRGMLLMSSLALFALGWLFVFVTSVTESETLRRLASEEDGGRIRWMRNLGLVKDSPSVDLIMASWNHPFILLTIAIWAIGRASIAVSGEIERGTLDLVLSRPVSRSSYLLSHVLVALSGLLLLGLALAAGAAAALPFNHLRVPPLSSTLLAPALNLTFLGLPIYGYTLFISAIDQVRWRPTMVGSVLTLLGFIAFVVSVIPVLENYAWRVWLERISIFTLFNPVEAVGPAELLGRNLAILFGLGVAFVALSFLGFLRRDLPANS